MIVSSRQVALSEAQQQRSTGTREEACAYTGTGVSGGGRPSGCRSLATSLQSAPLGPTLGMINDLRMGRSRTQ
jgi:hypothetical protein